MSKKPLFIVKYNVNPNHDKEFNEYYNEKIPKILKAVPEIISGKRLVMDRKGIKEYYTIYEIESEDKIESCLANIPDTQEWKDWVESSVTHLDNGVFKVICAYKKENDKIIEDNEE